MVDIDNGDNEIHYDITENELEDYIFNSEITDKEILKAVQALKRCKSAGFDEMIPGFLYKQYRHLYNYLRNFSIDSLIMGTIQNHGVIR